MIQSLFDMGKEKKFKQLFETYYAPFCLYARKYIDDSEICEDLVSDVFVSLWEQNIFDYSSVTALGYIKTCVKNSCLNYLKHQEHEWAYAEFVKYRSPDYELDTDSVYTLEELYEMLYSTLQQLPDSYRKVFVESFFNGKTHAEIAEELNLSVKSINRYKQKTIELLRKELKDFLPILLYFSLSWTEKS